MNKDWKSKERVGSVRELNVYKVAFEAAMKIFTVSKVFPAEERYSLTDQIRRSSRSVCTCLAEGWRKRRYQAVFINKLTDSAQEACETQTWLEFSLACDYIDDKKYRELDQQYEQVFAMLTSMERKANLFCN